MKIYKIKTNHVAQVIFNSTNLIMPHEFVENKFVQEFVTLSLLNIKTWVLFLNVNEFFYQVKFVKKKGHSWLLVTAY